MSTAALGKYYIVYSAAVVKSTVERSVFRNFYIQHLEIKVMIVIDATDET